MFAIELFPQWLYSFKCCCVLLYVWVGLSVVGGGGAELVQLLVLLVGFEDGNNELAVVLGRLQRQDDRLLLVRAGWGPGGCWRRMIGIWVSFLLLLGK